MSYAQPIIKTQSPKRKQYKNGLREEQKEKKKRHITEIVVPDINDSESIVPPMVAALSQHESDQWITWITYRRPSKASLKQMKANLSRLRIVYITEAVDARWIIWQALAQGNSHTVIAEQPYSLHNDIPVMEAASASSNTCGILVTSRQQHRFS